MRRLFVALLAVAAAPAAAQDHDAQAWPAVAASGRIAEHVVLSVEALARFSDDSGGLYEAEFGIDAAAKLSDTIRVSAGYANVPQYDRGARTSTENRLRPAVIIALGKLGGGDLSLRLRQEIRFRDDGADTGFRFRPRLAYARPLSSGGRIDFIATHESFVELNRTDWGQQGGYRRMRNFAGVNFPIVKGITAEAGYLNQWDFGKGDERDAVAHVAQLSLNYSF